MALFQNARGFDSRPGHGSPGMKMIRTLNTTLESKLVSYYNFLTRHINSTQAGEPVRQPYSYSVPSPPQIVQKYQHRLLGRYCKDDVDRYCKVVKTTCERFFSTSDICFMSRCLLSQTTADKYLTLQLLQDFLYPKETLTKREQNINVGK